MTINPDVDGRQSSGVPASPSGYSAEPEPSCTVSAVPVSIPNAARDALQLVPRDIFKQWGELDLGEPEQAWACAVDRFKEEARINRQCGEQMQRTADDALDQSKRHFERAFEFEAMARAIECSPITFPASGIETEGHDGATRHGAEHESPAPEGGDAQ